jgi:hypothetical protein
MILRLSIYTHRKVEMLPSNFLYHQLELQNYLQYIKQTKGAELHGFIRSVPKSEISKFLEHEVQGMKVGIR